MLKNASQYFNKTTLDVVYAIKLTKEHATRIEPRYYTDLDDDDWMPSTQHVGDDYYITCFNDTEEWKYDVDRTYLCYDETRCVYWAKSEWYFESEHIPFNNSEKHYVILKDTQNKYLGKENIDCVYSKFFVIRDFKDIDSDVIILKKNKIHFKPT